MGLPAYDAPHHTHHTTPHHTTHLLLRVERHHTNDWTKDLLTQTTAVISNVGDDGWSDVISLCPREHHDATSSTHVNILLRQHGSLEPTKYNVATLGDGNLNVVTHLKHQHRRTYMMHTTTHIYTHKSTHITHMHHHTHIHTQVSTHTCIITHMH